MLFISNHDCLLSNKRGHYIGLGANLNFGGLKGFLGKSPDYSCSQLRSSSYVTSYIFSSLDYIENHSLVILSYKSLSSVKLKTHIIVRQNKMVSYKLSNKDKLQHFIKKHSLKNITNKQLLKFLNYYKKNELYIKGNM